jgi:hypothetical protein
MTDFPHRGFAISVSIRRDKDMWDARTTVYPPNDLKHELGDPVTLDVTLLQTNRIEQVRAEAFEQAQGVINEIVSRRGDRPLRNTG